MPDELENLTPAAPSAETVTEPAALEPASQAAPDPGGQSTPDVTPSPSSGADKPEPTTPAEPKTLTEAVEAALAAKAKAETPPAEADAETKAQDGAGGDASKAPVEDGKTDEEADPTPEELAAEKPRTAKRMRTLIHQRNAARMEASELRGDAENYRQVREFMTTNRLVDGEVAELLQLGADLKSGDPERLQRFLSRAMGVAQNVMEATGRTVPRDLRQRVERGDLTEDVAKQVGQERFNRMRAEQEAAYQQGQSQQQAVIGRQRAITGAVETWQQQMRLSDPDFDMKVKAMTRVAQAMVAERGLPKSEADAVGMAKAAYDEVNAMYRQARPAPKASRPTPTSEPSANRAVPTTDFKSIADIVKAGMAMGNRA